MARILLFVVTLGGLAWLVSSVLTHASHTQAETQVPTRQLDNARQAAQRIEQQMQQRADEAARGTDSETPAADER